MTAEMTDDDLLTDQMAETMWGWVLPAIDAAIDGVQDPESLPVAKGSQLAKDDARSDPFQVSHCAQTCFGAGVDHLHAVKTLMFDLHTPLLHANADWSLIRGALDNFATAFWILHPNQRTYRIEHALRWRMQDYKSKKQATKSLAPGKEASVDAEVERVKQTAKNAGCNVKVVRDGYTGKTALEYVERYSHAMHPHFSQFVRNCG